MEYSMYLESRVNSHVNSNPSPPVYLVPSLNPPST